MLERISPANAIVLWGVRMWYCKCFVSLIVVVISGILSGCMALHTEFAKRDLDVQTRMTRTIFLEPVSVEKKAIFVQVTNTSGSRIFDLEPRVIRVIESKGYRIERDPERAQYRLRANVLHISKMNRREAESVFDSGFGGGLLGATLATVAGGDNRAVLSAGLAGAMLGIVADAAVKDTYYTIITDIQLAERAPGSRVVYRAGGKLQSRAEPIWQKHQTRVVSTANQVNLHLAQATPILVDELVNVIAGLV